MFIWNNTKYLYSLLQIVICVLCIVPFLYSLLSSQLVVVWTGERMNAYFCSVSFVSFRFYNICFAFIYIFNYIRIFIALILCQFCDKLCDSDIDKWCEFKKKQTKEKKEANEKKQRKKRCIKQKKYVVVVICRYGVCLLFSHLVVVHAWSHAHFSAVLDSFRFLNIFFAFIIPVYFLHWFFSNCAINCVVNCVDKKKRKRKKREVVVCRSWLDIWCLSWVFERNALTALCIYCVLIRYWAFDFVNSSIS